MDIELLLPYLLHPRTWESWVKTLVLETYVYDNANEIAVGHSKETGWFVLANPQNPHIVFMEHNGIPPEIDRVSSVSWDKIGRPKEFPTLEGVVASRDLMNQIFKFEKDELDTPIGEVKVHEVQNKVFTLVRIHPDLYRVLNIRQASAGPRRA